MRPFEIFLCLANVPLLVWCLSGRPLPRWSRVLPAVALLLMVLQVVVEGARWHIGPAYVVTIYLFLTCSWPRTVFVLPRWIALCAIGMLAGAAVLGTVLPVFELPKPTGAYPIGTVTVHLIDRSREETHGQRHGEYRELMIQIWYPAAWSGPGQAYRTRAEVELKKEHLTLVRTHAATGVPVAHAQSRYPVVIFSPAWTGPRNQNTVQAEELASHGFVVVGIDHPYGTWLTVFPDGRVARSTLDACLDYSSDEALAASIRNTESELRIRAPRTLNLSSRSSNAWTDPIRKGCSRADSTRPVWESLVIPLEDR